MPSLATRCSPLTTIKSQMGCWLNERWRAEKVLRLGIGSWLDLCNRSEELRRDEFSGGRVCLWRDSSMLTVCRVFPEVGERLLQHCLDQWPIRLNLDNTSSITDPPTASVLMVIGGCDRLPQFHLALAALRGQSFKAMELIVVEQGPLASLRGKLPADVRYRHDFSAEGTPFNKSRALNIAAEMALGEVLVIHDADFLVPADYIAEITRVLQKADGVRPARFIFYLNQETTKSLIQSNELLAACEIDYVTQNTPCPMALRTSTYWDIGGHDESFVGWGGEDTEFLSRLRTRVVAEGGWLPVVHLWHPPASKKINGDRNQAEQDALLAVPPVQRIQQLRSCLPGAERANSGALS
jgi:hypothetical protein